MLVSDDKRIKKSYVYMLIFELYNKPLSSTKNKIIKKEYKQVSL